MTAKTAVSDFWGARSSGSNLTSDRPRSEIVFWIAAVVVVFWHLGLRSLHGSEDRWAEVTREMFLRKDFFHPTLNGEPYFDKPLLGYWLVALITLVTGHLNEWAVRLPGALCGLATLWATHSLGRSLWSPAVGRTAAWLLLTSYGFFSWIMRGEADMENLAAITGATAWYWSRREKRDFLSYFVFYLICCVGAHTKGLTAMAVPAVILFPDFIRERRWRSHLNLAHVLAMGLGLAIYMLPFLYSRSTSAGYHENGLALVFRENVERYFHPFDHREPFYVYFYYLPELFLPWTPLLLIALAQLRGAFTRPYSPTRWLLEAAALVFLFFTLSGSRRSYYILPVLPFCAWATGLYLNGDTAAVWKTRALKLHKVALGLVVLLAVLSPLLLGRIAARRGFPVTPELLIGGPLLGLLGLAPWLIDRISGGRLAEFMGLRRELAQLVAATVLLAGGLFSWGFIKVDETRTIKPFAVRLGALARANPPEAIAAYREHRTQLFFYAGLPVPVHVFRTPEAMAAFLQSGGSKLVIVSEEDRDEALASLPVAVREHPSLSQEVKPWEKASGKLHAWLIGSKSAPSP